MTDDDGGPVAGARVTVYRWTSTGEPHSTVTDANGFYSVPFVAGYGVSALAEKEGYERTWRSQSTSRPAYLQFDIRIHRVER
ncbi:MAG: carboxypeptidase-like regulatory domain-containing protein [Gemmatimonadales bacterium]